MPRQNQKSGALARVGIVVLILGFALAGVAILSLPRETPGWVYVVLVMPALMLVGLGVMLSRRRKEN
jgi:peptidoglycan/LPS O-acetylase OafA/YrhL